MAEVERVPKGGHNSHFNYDFVRESDMLAAVRPLFAQKQLLMTMSAQPEHAKQNGNVLTVPYVCTIHDGESGETLSFTVLGAGQDTQDKGPYKALTGAVKYALMKLLMVDTGDDPENDAPRPQSQPPRQVPSGMGDPAPAPDPSGIEAVTVGIEKITMKQGEPPAKWTLFRIHTDSGLVLSTFSNTIAQTAKTLKESNKKAFIAYEVTPKGANLTFIEEAR